MNTRRGEGSAFRLPGSGDSFRSMAIASLRFTISMLILLGCLVPRSGRAADTGLLEIERQVSHGLVTNNGVRIHYATLGKKSPLVMMIHGLKDTALLSPALNGNWDFVEQDLTLVTIPNAGHFVQQDAPDLVARSIRSWLTR